MPLIKDIYRIVDRESYLDWGLTSDYESAKVAKVRIRQSKLRGAPKFAALGRDLGIRGQRTPSQADSLVSSATQFL
eukprot:4171943-Pleurochrysis_carterae.AAC.1